MTVTVGVQVWLFGGLGYDVDELNSHRLSSSAATSLSPCGRGRVGAGRRGSSGTSSISSPALGVFPTGSRRRVPTAGPKKKYLNDVFMFDLNCTTTTIKRKTSVEVENKGGLGNDYSGHADCSDDRGVALGERNESARGMRTRSAGRSRGTTTVVTLKWSRVSATGRPPTKRSGHSAIALGRYLVITGGANGNRYLPVEELHLLHTSRLVWSTLRPLENNISPVLTPGPLSPFWFPSQPWLPKSRIGSFPSTENACTDTVEAGKEISIGKWSKVEVEIGVGGGGMIQRLDGDAQNGLIGGRGVGGGEDHAVAYRPVAPRLRPALAATANGDVLFVFGGGLIVDPMGAGEELKSDGIKVTFRNVM